MSASESYSGVYFKYNLITEARLRNNVHPYDTVATDVSNNTFKMYKFNQHHYLQPRTIYNSIFQKVDLYPFEFTAQTYQFSFANCLFSTETEWYWNGTIIPITYNGTHNFQNLVDSLTAFANGLANSTHKTWLLTLLNGLFKTDVNGQTNRVVNAITYPIFNLYNPENRIVVDYSLNIANNNVALNMGDVSAGAKYVGAFMPNVGGEYTTSNKVSWQTPINVNPDGTDDEIEGDILVLGDIIEQSEFKEIIISQFRTQTRNRLKTNVFRFGDLRKFCGVQCSMKSAIDLGFYYGKNQPYNSNQKPLESFEIVQYDNLTTPSTTKPTFSAPTGGECKMWYWVLGTAKENQPVLFNDLVDLGITTNKSLSEYGTWAITTADSESNQLKAMTTLVELKDIKLSYAQLVLNINYDSDLIN
jgi:hypothetical protein